MNMNGPVYLSSASKKDNRVLNIDIPPKRLNANNSRQASAYGTKN